MKYKNCDGSTLWPEPLAEVRIKTLTHGLQLHLARPTVDMLNSRAALYTVSSKCSTATFHAYVEPGACWHLSLGGPLVRGFRARAASKGSR